MCEAIVLEGMGIVVGRTEERQTAKERERGREEERKRGREWHSSTVWPFKKGLSDIKTYGHQTPPTQQITKGVCFSGL